MKTTRDFLANQIIWSIAIAIASFGFFASTAHADPVLRGYWTFDSDTVDSGVITESSGYKPAGTHDGQLVGSGISFNSIEGQPGNHLSSGKYISFTNDSYAVILNTSLNVSEASPSGYQNTYDPTGADFTISAWVKGLPDGNWEPFVAKNGEGGYGWQLRRRETGNTPTFTYRISGGDDDPAVNIPGVNAALDDGNWHNLIAVYGGTYRELYMDGQLVTRIVDTRTSAGGQGEPLVFSGRYTGGAYTGFANISLDDVAFYDGALRNNQITYLNNGGDPTKLVAAEGKTIKISMANGNTYDNYTTLTRSGKTAHSWLDGEAIFYGSSGYLQTNLPVGSAGLNGSFTVSAWINMDDINGDQAIMGNTTWGTNNQSLHLVVANGKPVLGLYNNDLTANQTLEPNQWYYLTFQYDADAQTQRIFLNGEQIAERTGASAFAGGKTLEIGRMKETGNSYFRGRMKDIAITDAALSASEIQSMMNADRGSIRIEDFSMGKNTDEWYSGGGSTFGVLYSYEGKNSLHTYYGSSQDGTAANVYGQGNSDANTTVLWGPQFTVADNLPDDAVITYAVAGSPNALTLDSRSSGGAGVALWDLTTGDFVRDSSGAIISGHGNGTATWLTNSFSLKGLEGHNLMLVAADRHTSSWGWIAVTDITADITQVSPIANAAQHHLVLNDFNFDKAGDFNGMYEIDSAGNKLDTITNFQNGHLGPSTRISFYVDESGLADGKGFLSSSDSSDSEPATGRLRSDPFLVQGDILEFLISGGSADLHFDLIDADSGDVYFTTTGENYNGFRYDFWNLKDIQDKSVYIQVTDAKTASWAHLELDQIRQIKFAPTKAEVKASANVAKSANLDYDPELPGLNAESYDLTDTGISSLDDLAAYITGAEPTNQYYRQSLGGFSAGKGVGVDVFSTLNVDSSGQYTLAISNDEAYRLMLNGETFFESEGSDGLEFIPLTLSEIGQYALEMLYLDNSGKGVSLYMAEGAFDSWNSEFSLLTGLTDGYLNSFASYYVEDPSVPEPSTWALLILGAAGLLFIRKKK
ncbi:MAG: LamG domain-containing protein [Thermoguttaceae bacterium]|nr:LamG domain-containing protein [Thermoguttaceae bacterium]